MTGKLITSQKSVARVCAVIEIQQLIRLTGVIPRILLVIRRHFKTSLIKLIKKLSLNFALKAEIFTDFPTFEVTRKLIPGPTRPTQHAQLHCTYLLHENILSSRCQSLLKLTFNRFY